MIGYKDRAWCPLSVNTLCSRRQGCYRALTEEDRKAAEEWWGGPDFPIAVFSNIPDCFVPISSNQADGSK
jgi:hypothetical protein